MLASVMGKRALGAAGAALGLALILTAGPAAAQDAPRSGTFEALWSLKGTAQELELGAGRKTSTFRHTGTITFRNAQGLVGTALASCLGLGDTARGDVGRCVWVLEGGDRIFSELNGQLAPGPESGTVRGSFVGGNRPLPADLRKLRAGLGGAPDRGARRLPGPDRAHVRKLEDALKWP